MAGKSHPRALALPSAWSSLLNRRAHLPRSLGLSCSSSGLARTFRGHKGLQASSAFFDPALLSEPRKDRALPLILLAHSSVKEPGKGVGEEEGGAQGHSASSKVP